MLQNIGFMLRFRLRAKPLMVTKGHLPAGVMVLVKVESLRIQ